MNDQTLFHEALKRPLAERESFLREACGSDLSRRKRLETLLAAHEHPDGFLVQPCVPLPNVNAAAAAEQASDSASNLDFLEAPTRPDTLGRLGHYEILSIVGRGGFGIVLRAFDEKLHRVVAIKVLSAALAASATARRRFAREAQAAAAVSHDNIVRIYAVEEAAPIPYLVMEFVEGISLDDKLKQEGPLDLKESLRIGLQIADGLSAAHKQGLVHRDVKPANILLENGIQRVKITDFGLARAVDDVSLTQSGVIAGTPLFMSPEQARGEPVDARSDLFSLGSVLYALCAGQPPFRGSTTLTVIKRVCEESPRPIRELNPDVPQWLVQTIDRLLAKRPAERFQSAAEVTERLGQRLALLQQPAIAVQGDKLSPDAGAASKTAARGRRWLPIAAAALLLLIACLGLSEATGVTQLSATVIRIFTPEGTLVVEASDPDVKVTIEGDGGLSITTAGGQQVRLPAGASYRLRAAKDGQPVALDRELITITQGQKQIVRVRLEPPVPAAETSAAVVPQRSPFVILRGDDGLKRDYETLAAAVADARDGDTIEIRGNGPFASAAIRLSTRVTIRAGQGFQPVIRPLGSEDVLLEAQAGLVAEGLEFQCGAGSAGKLAIAVSQAPAYIANCRFTGCTLSVQNLPYFRMRNCQISTPHGDAVWTANCPLLRRIVVDNNMVMTQTSPGLSFDVVRNATTSAELQFTRNLVMGPNVMALTYYHQQSPETEIPLRVHACRNVFAVDQVVIQFLFARRDTPTARLGGEEAEKLMRKVVTWSEEENAYPENATFVKFLAAGTPFVEIPATGPAQSLDQWHGFWGLMDTGCVQGRIQFARADAVLPTIPAKIDLSDFQLTPESAGYKAGPDERDLGPDLSIVGPGAAYERWKQSPDYQQWLRDSG